MNLRTRVLIFITCITIDNLLDLTLSFPLELFLVSLISTGTRVLQTIGPPCFH